MIQLSVERVLCCAAGELLQEKHIIVIAPLPLSIYCLAACSRLLQSSSIHTHWSVKKLLFEPSCRSSIQNSSNCITLSNICRRQAQCIGGWFQSQVEHDNEDDGNGNGDDNNEGKRQHSINGSSSSSGNNKKWEQSKSYGVYAVLVLSHGPLR